MNDHWTVPRELRRALGTSLRGEEKHIKARVERIQAELKALDRTALNGLLATNRLRADLLAVFPAIPYCIDLIDGPYLTTNEALVKAFPGNPQYRFDLVTAINSAGNLHRRNDEVEDEIEVLEAEVMPENHRMADVFRRSGFPVRVVAAAGLFDVGGNALYVVARESLPIGLAAAPLPSVGVEKSDATASAVSVSAIGCCRRARPTWPSRRPDGTRCSSCGATPPISTAWSGARSAAGRSRAGPSWDRPRRL